MTSSRILLVATVVLALSHLAWSVPMSLSTMSFRDMSNANMARHELVAELSKGDNYESGGCTPLISWESYAKKHLQSDWTDWEKRVPALAKKVEAASTPNAKARVIFDSLGDSSLYLQYVDGRSQYKGESAFGPNYMVDMKYAHKIFAELMESSGLTRNTVNEAFYDKIHTEVFKGSAKELSKTNGYRGPNSWVYLPMPDRPLGVYHNIHKDGKLNFDPRLRKMLKNSEYKIIGWKYNQRHQYRWQYPNMKIADEKKIVQGLFDKFWDMIEAVPDTEALPKKRNLQFNAVVWLFHSLENFHCFIDGNGRTNLLLMQGLLSWFGLHPVSYYNSMESALTAVEEEREVLMEAFLKWETSYKTGKTAWTDEEIGRKKKECEIVTKNLLEPYKAGDAPRPWQPDTHGGCMCEASDSCESNAPYHGQKWCYTNKNCFWKWDYCADGRSSAPGAPAPLNPPKA